MQSVIIEERLKNIRYDAFEDCKKCCTSKNFKEIGENYFKGCEDLTIIAPESLKLPDDILKNKNIKIIRKKSKEYLQERER